MSTVKEIFQFDSGGIVYKDANGVILGTGTAQDSAAPDPETNNGVFLYCQSPARTLYIVANQTFTYRIKNSLAITGTPTRNQLLTILSQNFFFRVTGGGPETQNLNDVLTIGNSAGANDIDMNGQDITNVNEISSAGDLFLNPVGSIDANGKTLNMTGGEIHNLNLAHGQNNTDLIIEGKGTGQIAFKTGNNSLLKILSGAGIDFLTYISLNGYDIKNVNTVSGKNNANLNLESSGTGGLILKTNNVDRLKITDTGNLIFTFFYTVELMAALTVDFYAPFDLKISSIINLVNSPTTTILDDGAAYTLGNTILAGSKITVTVNTAAVVNLKTIQV